MTTGSAARAPGDAAYVDLDAWAAVAAGGPVPRELEGAPGLDLAVAATADPLVILGLDVSAPGGLFSHQAWLGRDAVAVLLDRDQDERRLVCLPPDHLPITLARLVGLGPRPTLPRRDAEPLGRDPEDWFAVDPEQRRAALVAAGTDRAWRLALVQAGASPEQATLLAAVDGPDGPCWVEPAGTSWRLAPTRPTDVFTAFCALLAGVG